jgi:hypothetical protein
VGDARLGVPGVLAFQTDAVTAAGVIEGAAAQWSLRRTTVEAIEPPAVLQPVFEASRTVTVTADGVSATSTWSR